MSLSDKRQDVVFKDVIATKDVKEAVKRAYIIVKDPLVSIEIKLKILNQIFGKDLI